MSNPTTAESKAEFTKSPEELKLKSTSSVQNQLLSSAVASTSTTTKNGLSKDEETSGDPDKRPEGWGTRVLQDEDQVFTMNAWDHAPPPEDLDERAEAVKQVQREHQVSDLMKDVYNKNPASFWDRFYNTHNENFFKDRKWLRLEFPELLQMTAADAGPRTIVEIGCGAGNALFPILENNKNPLLNLHGFDYSRSAVEVVRSNPSYAKPPMGKINAAVWDLSSESIPEDVPEGTVDVAVMVFVLSALKPGDEWERAMGNVWKMLKPGGLILFRDYGRHDLAQMRIKKNRMLDEDFYIRGDGTRVFFFSADDLSKIFTGRSITSPVDVTTTTTTAPNGIDDGPSLSPSQVNTPQPPSPSPILPDMNALSAAVDKLAMSGEESIVEKTTESQQDQQQLTAQEGTNSVYFPEDGKSKWHGEHPLFEFEQLGVDRRLLVNRKKQLKMYRVWMQVKARKLLKGAEGGTVQSDILTVQEEPYRFHE
ncbi:Predicted methyltransferase [Phaffia rhodozyma]|uniref:Predicted methyltransferase n=1 Tax=Phaffia rhodozyma TaxID=264483 RepID=A0A0F7SMH5_PHARH|nr:Predicted methyltransferase [Phaffia rhodozyma]